MRIYVQQLQEKISAHHLLCMSNSLNFILWVIGISVFTNQDFFVPLPSADLDTSSNSHTSRNCLWEHFRLWLLVSCMSEVFCILFIIVQFVPNNCLQLEPAAHKIAKFRFLIVMQIVFRVSCWYEPIMAVSFSVLIPLWHPIMTAWKVHTQEIMQLFFGGYNLWGCRAWK